MGGAPVSPTVVARFVRSQGHVFMPLTWMLAAGLALAAVGQQDAPATADPGAGFVSLFNGRDLDGWYTFLQEHGHDRDPDGIIAIHDGVIHLYRDTPDATKVVMGYIGTKREYGNYHLKLEYR